MIQYTKQMMLFTSIFDKKLEVDFKGGEAMMPDCFFLGSCNPGLKVIR